MPYWNKQFELQMYVLCQEKHELKLNFHEAMTVARLGCIHISVYSM